MKGISTSLGKYFCLAFVIVVLCASCKNDIAEVQAIFEPHVLQNETAFDVEMLYSDSALVRAKIVTPKLVNMAGKKQPIMEFPIGVHMEFFDEAGNMSSWLDAKKATRYEKDEYIMVEDSVVLHNRSGEVMKTEELIWDEKDGIVYTNKFIKFVKPNGEIFYGYGFKTNEDFTRYEIYNGDGLLQLNEIQSTIKN